jgi:hypothetical protein
VKGLREMPTLTILGKATDQRTATRVVYAQLTVDDYLGLVGENFDKFPIQRRREKHRGYERLKSDVIAGALLPTITLAYDPETVAPLQGYFDKGQDAELVTALCEQGKASILDGLQRTYILSELRKANVGFKQGQTLLVEFWLEEKPRNLIYRIIVLNAGQKPMSMRHQLEVLFSTFKTLLERDIQGLDLLTERETSRRTRPRKYGLDRAVSAYHAFLLKGTEIQKENVVAQRIVDEDILSGDEDALNRSLNEFKRYLKDYCELDDQICRIYDGTQTEIPTGADWFGRENVMVAFFAAISDFASRPDRTDRVGQALASLKSTLSATAVGENPLRLDVLQTVTQGIDTKKINVGYATRKLLFNSFKEFFREAGEKGLGDLWASEAE